MYFKELEIVGFKSFPYKTKLKFEPGITGVVGPNGCGKSNISDAIRWVLGEQSPKSLRGSCMNDVIFNGTDQIEPINMAEVTLTLSNEKRLLPIDYDEVTITRRLFRSGESEYLLNRTPVRLKDISHLLMGTGLGTGSYSIIEQGKIDLILSSKPEERRYVFEEASGITRYKAKKKEAMKKLEHTENNLVRINDIITEVKRQISSIERHARKAEKYKTDFELMKEMDLKIAAHELGNINRAIDASRERLASQRLEEKKLSQEIDEANERINGYREYLEGTISKLSEAQKKLSNVTLFVDKGRHKLELNKERIDELLNLRADSEKEFAKLRERVDLQRDELKKIEERLRGIQNTKSNNEEKLLQNEQLVQRLSREIEEHQEDIRFSKNRSVDLLAAQTKTKNELIKLGADLQNRKLRLRRLQAEKQDVDAEKRRLEKRFREASNELAACESRIREKKNRLEEIERRLALCEKSLGNTRKQIIASENAFNSLGSKEEILREMIDNFEGFDRAVKLVAEAVRSASLEGVVGIVADMLEPDAGYEHALEAALGRKAQAVVVKDENALRRVLEFLKDKGAAHIIVSEDVKEASGADHAAPFMQNDSMPPLSSFVNINPLYKPVLDYLLGGIYVAEDAEKAYEALKGRRENARFATKTGFFIEKGCIYGGSAKGGAVSIVGRAKRLKEIQDKKARLEEEVARLRREEDKEREMFEELKQKIKLADEELKKEEIDFANALSRKETEEGNLKKINEEIQIIQLEIGEVDELVHDISLKGDQLNRRLNENEAEYAGVQERISSLQDAVQRKTKEKNDLIFEISELKSEIAFLKNTEEQESRNLARGRDLFHELELQYENRQKAWQDAEGKIGALREESENLEREMKEAEKEKEALKGDLEEISKKRNEISQVLHNEESSSREKERLIEGLRNEIRNTEIKQRENELIAVNIKERVRQAYKLDITELNVQVDENANWEEIKNQVDVLRIKLEKLGPVNLVAIEEHRELEERYSFLTQQQDDLLRAKESLHKAITKINKTTRRLFMEAFQKIQVEFRNYFRMLFGGGHAELLLIDESDVLESGIEIVARPPGKKLQNLLLLSGGEKALTAIALLFAIFKVKPSPFCILDEVDAPLDESSIGRFTQILQEFLKTSQFIVITHNKKTMQMANVLYGITMENKGVSKIVSVKFAEDEKKSAEKEKVPV